MLQKKVRGNTAKIVTKLLLVYRNPRHYWIYGVFESPAKVLFQDFGAKFRTFSRIIQDFLSDKNFDSCSPDPAEKISAPVKIR